MCPSLFPLLLLLFRYVFSGYSSIPQSHSPLPPPPPANPPPSAIVFFAVPHYSHLSVFLPIVRETSKRFRDQSAVEVYFSDSERFHDMLPEGVIPILSFTEEFSREVGDGIIKTQCFGDLHHQGDDEKEEEEKKKWASGRGLTAWEESQRICCLLGSIEKAYSSFDVFVENLIRERGEENVLLVWDETAIMAPTSSLFRKSVRRMFIATIPTDSHHEAIGFPSAINNPSLVGQVTLWSVVKEMSSAIVLSVLCDKFRFMMATVPSLIDSTLVLVPSVVGFDYAIQGYPKQLSRHVGMIGFNEEERSRRVDAVAQNEVQDFLETHENENVVLVSPGTVMAFPEILLRPLFAAFEKLELSVIFLGSLTSESSLVEDFERDVLVPSGWIDQLRVLNHPCVKVHVGHGGGGGIFESIKSGVPMLLIPLVSDSFGNSARVIERKLGRRVLEEDFSRLETVDERTDLFVESLSDLLEDEQYVLNLEKVAHISRLAGEEKQAAKYVEEVFLFGTEHLVPIHVDLGLGSLKFVFVLLAIALHFVVLRRHIFRCCLLCCCCCCRERKAKND